ncbi:MAG: hypothetical protein WAQ98_26720 [Blastocatellia bacterium]
MSDLLIKREHLPERCEVCHQSDAFDPISGKCSRCEGLFAEKEEETKKIKPEFELIKPTVPSAFQALINKQNAPKPITKDSPMLDQVLSPITEFFQPEKIDATQPENLIPLIKAEYFYNLKIALAFGLVLFTILSIASLFMKVAVLGLGFFLVVYSIEFIFNWIKWKRIINKLFRIEPLQRVVILRKEYDSENTTEFYAEIYRANEAKKSYTSETYEDKVKVIKPSWYEESKLNKAIDARVFKVKKKQIIIHTTEGILVSV